MIWELIWINLAYDSVLVHWFTNKVSPGNSFSKAMLDEYAINELSGTKNTITYAIGGFMQIFNYSPIGEVLHQGENVDGKTYVRSVHRELSDIALAYSLYKYAENKDIISLRIEDFYDSNCHNGPVKEFGLPKSQFEKILRQINSSTNRVLIAELNMGLDSITLRDDLSSMKVLKQLVI